MNEKEKKLSVYKIAFMDSSYKCAIWKTFLNENIPKIFIECKTYCLTIQNGRTDCASII